MSEQKTARAARASARAIAARYEKVDIRTEPLSRLCDLLPGTPDPLEEADRENLIGREEWESLDTRRRNQTVGFLRRDHLRSRHQVQPPRLFLRGLRDPFLDKAHAKVVKDPKIVFRYRDAPMAALTGRNTLSVEPLLALVPRLKSTPTADLPVILNSRLFHFYYVHYHGKPTGKDALPAEARLEGFEVPMLTKKTGGPFREARDEIFDLARRNSERLAAMDHVQRLAEEGRIPLVPLARTEGIIREINVPRALGEVADVKRRGPVVIFRRGSTIVTTTEEAATYLELWLQQRFDRLRGMNKDQLEEYIKLPATTAHVVMTLQRRTKIENEVEKAQTKIDDLQRQAEDHLYDLYGLTEAEREFLRANWS